MVRQKRRLAQATIITVGLLCALLLASSSASATIQHSFIGSTNGSDAPGGPLGILLTSDAIDQTSGDVYVLESNAFEFGVGAIDKFDETGAYAGVQIVGADTPQGTFAFAPFTSSLAVDNSLSVNSHDVYVADTEHGVVDKFDESGSFVCQITGHKPASPEEEEHECAGAPGSETPNGSISPTGLAVDASGNVFVADTAHAVVDKFSATGAYVSQIADEHLGGELGTLALDASGDLFVTNFASSVVEYGPSGTFLRTLDESAPAGVGVDPSNGHAYVTTGTEPHHISEYAANGELLDTFGEDHLEGEPSGVAVNGTTGHVFTVELQFCTGCSKLIIFGPGVVVPDVMTGPAIDVERTSATLTGQVAPDAAHGGGEVTACDFEYVTDAQFQAHPGNHYEGAATAVCNPPTTNAATEVTANVSLTPGTTYHFRLVASNADGTALGGDETLTTSGPASIDEESATSKARGATLRAQINPLGFATSCTVQYVSDVSFQASGYASATSQPCSPSELGATFGDRAVSVVVTGLQINTTYHYRFMANSDAGPTTGEDETFKTFGLEAFEFEALDSAGKPYTQAGGHPYKWRINIALDKTQTSDGTSATPANLKDVVTELPAGFVGVPTASARCTRDQLANAECSGASQLGVLRVLDSHGASVESGVYNLVPRAGIPAEFGAKLNSVVSVYLDSNVRSNGDYGVTTTVSNISTGLGVVATTVELWGVPGDSSHDSERACPSPGKGVQSPCSANTPLVPFLVNPTSCVGPQSATVHADTWQAQGEFVTATASLPAITGCERPGFTPNVSIQPGTTVADSPTGLHIDLQVPQNENPNGLEAANLKQAVVALPTGVSVSPSAAAGLEACAPSQIGLSSTEPATCPEASKVGSVEIDSPLLPDHLKGGVYVAKQNDNPFNSLLAIYLTASADGAVVKLAGHVVADPVTGQLTTTFDNNPQLPFSDLKVDLFGGPRGVLATPASCGAFTSNASFAPWTGMSPALLGSAFQISSGCSGAFAPGFSAGTTISRAGAYAPFSLAFSRSDGEQGLSGLTATLPPGLLAKIAGVPLCSDADASAGACPEAAQIGTVTTGAGPGSSPLFLPGKIYLTGPYKGAPYGEAVVVPAIAGPFNLGNVVVRGAIHIDPTTAQATVVSDAFPTILEGIPIRLRQVSVLLSRPGFTFNPTSCNPLTLTGTLASTAGANVAVSSAFQVGGCGELPFKPSFSASTRGPGTKANGASLDVKVAAAGQGPQASSAAHPEANIRKVDVQLPLALPSRLTTLQKACTEQQFASNPAGCPSASLVGSAVARTPVLADPLTGPAYLVSHGGEAFPDLVLILQADGITIDLTGHTQITKGITYSHFETVPDAPISSFELKLPEGKFSVLAANGDLCATTKTVTTRKRVTVRKHGRLVHVMRTVKKSVPAPLLMPTTITGQNGTVLKQTTKIAVTGCTKAKPKPAKKRKRVQKGARKRA
jgi:hypothetical protein